MSKNNHNIHIKDAIYAYKLINRITNPSYATSFDLAIVNHTVSRINGGKTKSIIKLSEDEYASYLAILEHNGN